MKLSNLATLAAISFWSFGIFLSAQAGPKQSAKKGKAAPASSASRAGSDGEQVFQTHCGRCHNEPESISPREARAVARHMRVRAMLSSEDEKLLLEFLAP